MKRVKEIWTNGNEFKLVTIEIKETVIEERMITHEQANTISQNDKNIDVKQKEW